MRGWFRCGKTCIYKWITYASVSNFIFSNEILSCYRGWSVIYVAWQGMSNQSVLIRTWKRPTQRRYVEQGWGQWGQVTHVFVGNLTIIDSDNGLSPGRRQTIIWTNARILLIGPLGRKFNEILIRNAHICIQENALQNVVCEMASIVSRP